MIPTSGGTCVACCVMLRSGSAPGGFSAAKAPLGSSCQDYCAHSKTPDKGESGTSPRLLSSPRKLESSYFKGFWAAAQRFAAGMTVFAHRGIFLQPATRDRSGSPGDPNDPFAIVRRNVSYFRQRSAAL